MEGLTLSKALGIFIIAPVIGYFIKSPWKYTAGIIPFYLLCKPFTSAGINNLMYWLYIAGGLAVHLFFINIF